MSLIDAAFRLDSSRPKVNVVWGGNEHVPAIGRPVSIVGSNPEAPAGWPDGSDRPERKVRTEATRLRSDKQTLMIMRDATNTSTPFGPERSQRYQFRIAARVRDLGQEMACPL